MPWRVYMQKAVFLHFGLVMVYPLPKSSLNLRSNSSHTNPPYVPFLFPTFTAITPGRNVPLQSIGTVLITQAKSAERVGFFLGGLVELVVNLVSWHVISYLCLA
jgi:hypothetical protein